MKKHVRVILSILTACMIIAQVGCAGKTQEPVVRQSFYFDTVCSIAVYDMKNMSEEAAAKAIEEAFAQCSRYESLLSRTKEGTDVYKINHAGGKAVACDPETVEVIRKGLYYSEMSGGVFDITIGKVTDLWDFHAEEPQVPDAEALRKAAETVNYKSVVIDGNNVSLTDPDAHIDLGGIAKGYIADRVGDVLSEHGVTSAVISLGGNVVCVGGKIEKGAETPFRVGIEKPYSNESEIVGVVNATDETVVTSGIYQRYFESDGVMYHHILDATTGYPAVSDVVGVTLKAERGQSADCDALATIMLILGEEKGIELARKTEGVEAYFLLTDGSSAATEGMEVEQ